MLIVFYLLFSSLLCQLTASAIDLSQSESSFYSPNGEDGVLARIFTALKPQQHTCVECGAYDGITNSLTYLLRNQGWKALLLDRAFDIPSFNLHKEFITASNINQLFEKYEAQNTFDLLVIDIGCNDFYIWKALDPRYQPSVICIAYNGYHKYDEDKIVIYHPFFTGDHTDYFGASILALNHLGKSKGYTLIYAEESGQHLFFIRDDILEQRHIVFQDMGDVEKLYRPYHLESGTSQHANDPLNRKYISWEKAMR